MQEAKRSPDRWGGDPGSGAAGGLIGAIAAAAASGAGGNSGTLLRRGLGATLQGRASHADSYFTASCGGVTQHTPHRKVSSSRPPHGQKKKAARGWAA